MPGKILFWTCIIVGSFSLFFSLFADGILPSPSPGFGLGQLAGAILSLFTLSLASDRSRRFLWNDLPVIMMNTIVLILILDLVAFMVSRRMASRPPSENRCEQVEEQLYQPPPSCYCPFVFLRLQPNYSALGVHTDHQGFRVTPGASMDDSAITVNVYGGSTAYGWVLHDSSTVTAFLQRRLDECFDVPVRVCNRAAATRNSTHSMIEFLLAIQAGDIPRAAVFYEGYNDAATTWYEAKPGTLMGLRRMRNLLGPGRETRARGWSPLENISLLRLAYSLVPEREEAPVLIESEPLSRGMDMERLARGTIDIFNSNRRQIGLIADAFGVSVLVFWQPALAGETRPLFKYEQDYIETMDQGEVDFQRIVWAMARESFQDDDTWLGDATVDADSYVYDDYCHMNVYGTSLVARRIAERLIPVLNGGS